MCRCAADQSRCFRGISCITGAFQSHSFCSGEMRICVRLCSEEMEREINQNETLSDTEIRHAHIGCFTVSAIVILI